VSAQQWDEVDAYLTDLLVAEEPALQQARAAADAANLPAIAVSAPQGKLLHLLARVSGARRILEIGTLGGYSAIWLARALPADGRLVTLEVDVRHAEVAAANFEHAGVGELVDLRLGPALHTLPLLESEGLPPFDLVFIDADKQSTADYFRWALALTRVGSLIVVDNVIRGGGVIDARSEDPAVQGVRRFNEMLAHEPTVSATAIQTVGSKGWDGFALALVTG
jgi:predicted O-methyltransferase YrrM